LEVVSEYDYYITFDKIKSEIGLLYNNSIINSNDIEDDTEIKSVYSESHPYIITKADGDYNHQAYTLLENINNKIDLLLNHRDETISSEYDMFDENDFDDNDDYDDLLFGANKIKTKNSSIIENNDKQEKNTIIIHPKTISDNKLSLNEENLRLRLLNDSNNNIELSYLSNLLNTPEVRVLINSNNILDYKNIVIPKIYLNNL
jgi:hypothetical protein